jgi:hypothetical protein
MFPSLSVALLATPLIVAAADQVPSFDVNPTCRGADAAAGAGGRGSDVCVRSELGARDQLTQQWAQFPEADRTRCVSVTRMTAMPSYVQVLTCLEMARDSRQLNPRERSTVGASPAR